MSKYIYILVSVFLLACAVFLPVIFKNPLFVPGEKVRLADFQKAEEVFSVTIEDGFNIPVILERKAGTAETWELVFDGTTRYPADAYKIRDFLSAVSLKDRFLRPVPTTEGLDFLLKISFFSENSISAGTIYADRAEAGGGFRYVKLPSGIFKTEDFFSVPGLTVENIAALKTWINRSPFRNIFTQGILGNIQRIVFRDFNPGSREEGGQREYIQAVFSTGTSNKSDSVLIEKTERMVSGLECTDITNLPFEKLFEIVCTTGYDRNITFYFGLIFTGGTTAAQETESRIYGIVSESGRNWVTGSQSVLDIYSLFKNNGTEE